MEFWRLIQKPMRQKSLVVKLMRDVESGHFSIPKAYDVLTRFRTEELSFGASSQHLKANLPEKSLIRAFLQKYPEAKSEPIALDSFVAPLARRFVQRQLLLMQEGRGAEQAFAQAEQEFAAQLTEMRSRHLGTLGGGSSPLELLQQHEQEQLDAGLGALAQQRQEGPKAVAQGGGGGGQAAVRG